MLQRTAGVATLGELEALGLLRPEDLPDLDPPAPGRIDDLVSRARPGGNANAPAVAELDRLQRWLDDHGTSYAGRTVQEVIDAVGAAAALGARWAA